MTVVDQASLVEALRTGVELHRQGHLDQALAVYSDILDLAPEQPDALHFLGLLEFQRGEPERGLEHVERALRVAPENSGMWSNFGNLLMEAGRREQAVEAYRTAVKLAPEFPDGYCNLGVVLRALGRKEEAIAAFTRAVALDEHHFGALHNLGNLHLSMDDPEAAAACYWKVVLSPRADASVKSTTAGSLIKLLIKAGSMNEARRLLDEWLGWDPKDPIAAHLQAAIGAGADAAPVRASDGYIRSVFDEFAQTFDVVLKELEYRAPSLVARWVAERLGPEPGRLAILDAGCGTGLSGDLLKPHASRLVGLDISAGMLRQAAAKGFYDELVEAEMSGYLAAAPERYDLIACVDAIIYFGDLADVLAGFRAALHPGAWACFTVEKGLGSGYRLQVNGRYRHAPQYLRRVLAESGFEEVEVKDVMLRLEGGQPVQGLLVAARAPHRSAAL